MPSTENKADEQIPVGLVSTSALRDYARRVDPVSARWYLIEFHRRFALPTACLVLAMVGIPLGLSSKKSGKSGGFVLTIVLVFVYYFVSLIGVSLARQGKVGPMFGAWLANIAFFAAGAILAVASGTPAHCAFGDPLSGVNAIASRPTATSPRSDWDAETAPTLSSAPPPAGASSAPAFPRCSMTTCCAISSFTWE